MSWHGCWTEFFTFNPPPRGKGRKKAFQKNDCHNAWFWYPQPGVKVGHMRSWDWKTKVQLQEQVFPFFGWTSQYRITEIWNARVHVQINTDVSGHSQLITETLVSHRSVRWPTRKTANSPPLTLLQYTFSCLEHLLFLKLCRVSKCPTRVVPSHKREIAENMMRLAPLAAVTRKMPCRQKWIRFSTFWVLHVFRKRERDTCVSRDRVHVFTKKKEKVWSALVKVNEQKRLEVALGAPHQQMENRSKNTKKCQKCKLLWKTPNIKFWGS